MKKILNFLLSGFLFGVGVAIGYLFGSVFGWLYLALGFIGYATIAGIIFLFAKMVDPYAIAKFREERPSFIPFSVGLAIGFGIGMVHYIWSVT